MGVRIFVGRESGLDDADDQAVLICSTSGTAFGPIMDSYETAAAFLAWHHERPHTDVRECSSGDLEDRYWTFKAEPRHEPQRAKCPRCGAETVMDEKSLTDDERLCDSCWKHGELHIQRVAVFPRLG